MAWGESQREDTVSTTEQTEPDECMNAANDWRRAREAENAHANTVSRWLHRMRQETRTLRRRVEDRDTDLERLTAELHHWRALAEAAERSRDRLHGERDRWEAEARHHEDAARKARDELREVERELTAVLDQLAAERRDRGAAEDWAHEEVNRRQLVARRYAALVKVLKESRAGWRRKAEEWESSAREWMRLGILFGLIVVYLAFHLALG